MTAEDLVKMAVACNKDAHAVLSDLDDTEVRKFVNDNKKFLSGYELYILDALSKHGLMASDSYSDCPKYHRATCDEEVEKYYSLAHTIISKVIQREEDDECVLTLYGRRNETDGISGRVVMKMLTYGRALECIKDSQTDYNGSARIEFKDGFSKRYKNYGEEIVLCLKEISHDDIHYHSESVTYKEYII